MSPVSIHLHWYLPTNGDSREIVGSGDDSHFAVGPTASRIRPPSIDYLGEIARTAELLGFESVLTPTGTWCEDAWITTAALSQVTTRLKFLVAFRPGLITPTLAAHQAATSSAAPDAPPKKICGGSQSPKSMRAPSIR
jgi:alkanesulfonate monooxygenase